jgi:hypothetical protein
MAAQIAVQGDTVRRDLGTGTDALRDGTNGQAPLAARRNRRHDGGKQGVGAVNHHRIRRGLLPFQIAIDLGHYDCMDYAGAATPC